MRMKRWAAAMLAVLYCGTLLPLQALAETTVYGDVNGDGNVNAMDASLILVDAAALAAGLDGCLTADARTQGDVDENGSANAVDASILLQYASSVAAGKIETDLKDYYTQLTQDVTSLPVPEMIVGKWDSAVRVKWDLQLPATGYEIYRSTSASAAVSSYTKIADIQGDLRYVDEGLDNDTAYYYSMRSYRVQSDGTVIYSDYADVQSSATTMAILNGADLDPKNSIRMYNRQVPEADTTYYEVELTENDIAIIEAFLDEHFTEDATQEEILWETMYWIHTEVDYAYAGDAWNEIAGLSWVEAIFVHQKGQCVQYNGALASMMAYFGYDVSMVQGWRGTYPSNYWQHFWAEVNIGGTLYIMECGNLGKNGNWYYFLSEYDETSKYIRNCINM